MKKLIHLGMLVACLGFGNLAFAETGELSLHQAAKPLLNRQGELQKDGSNCMLIFESDNLGERYKIVGSGTSFAGFPFNGPDEVGAQVTMKSEDTWEIESSDPGSPDEGERGHRETYSITINATSVTIEGGGSSATCVY